MDIWGPFHKYFLIVVDGKIRLTRIFLMKCKSEIPNLIKASFSMIHTQFNSNIKCIRSDNGGEFILIYFYRETGISHHTSCIGTPQQNDIFERKHQHIFGISRSFLFQTHLPKSSGLIRPVMIFTLSIDFPHLSWTTSHHFNFYINAYLILIFLEYLALYVLLQPYKPLERN